MEDITKEVLDNYFADFKQYHTLITAGALLLFAIIIFISNFFRDRKLKKDLSKFNSLLKKNEIRFSKYYVLRIEALSKLYSLFFKFQYSNNLLFSEKYDNNNGIPYNDNNEIQLYCKRINLWDKNLRELYFFFYKNKILFSTNEGGLQKIMDSYLQDSKQIKSLLIEDNKEFMYFESQELRSIYDNGDLADYYYSQGKKVQEEVNNIKNKPKVKKMIEKFEEIKLVIESEFKELTKD